MRIKTVVKNTSTIKKHIVLACFFFRSFLGCGPCSQNISFPNQTKQNETINCILSRSFFGVFLCCLNMVPPLMVPYTLSSTPVLALGTCWNPDGDDGNGVAVGVAGGSGDVDGCLVWPGVSGFCCENDCFFLVSSMVFSLWLSLIAFCHDGEYHRSDNMMKWRVYRIVMVKSLLVLMAWVMITMVMVIL